MKNVGNFISTTLWFLALAAVVNLLSGCAVTQRETDMNNNRQQSFKELNSQKTYSPVTISGVTSMAGNITITTMAETTVTQVPDIQYDTSRNDLIGKAIGTVERVALGGITAYGIVEGVKAIGDATQQPEPLMVRPEVVEVPVTDDFPVSDTQASDAAMQSVDAQIEAMQ